LELHRELLSTMEGSWNLARSGRGPQWHDGRNTA
jgi:hypothetical protein